MKIQINIIMEIIKKNKLWIAILFVLSVLSIVSYKIRPEAIGIGAADFLSIINYPNLNTKTILNIIMSIY